MNAARFAQIEVTTICNFDCFYCAGRDMAQRHMEMPVFGRVLAQLPSNTGMTVSLQGEGEPTLHPAFWDMVLAVRAQGLRSYTITNGTRVDAAQFAAALDSVGVSVDTLDEDEARRIGRYNLPKVLANLESLIRTMGLGRVAVHTVMYGQDIVPLQAYLASIGGPRQILQPLQVKDDYVRHYALQQGGQPVKLVPPAPRSLAYYRCGFLDRPRMRYFNIDGTEMPCCFIKDASAYTSADDLRRTLARRVIPAACAGCRELR